MAIRLDLKYADWDTPGLNEIENSPLGFAAVLLFEMLGCNLETLLVLEKPMDGGIPWAVPFALISGIIRNVFEFAA